MAIVRLLAAGNDCFKSATILENQVKVIPAEVLTMAKSQVITNMVLSNLNGYFSPTQ